MDLEELWAGPGGPGAGRARPGTRDRGPGGDPEFGPYTGYAFASGGETFPPGYRMLRGAFPRSRSRPGGELT